MLKDFIFKNIAYKILAALLAVLLYFYVLSEQNPIIQRVFSVNLEMRNLSSTLQPIKSPPPVNVTLQGSRKIINSLTEEQIKAYVDLKNITVGTHSLKIHVLAPPEVELIKLSPRQLTLKLDRIVQQKMPIEINSIGTPPPNYYIEKEEINPSTAQVEGLESKVKRVRHLIATIDVSGLIHSKEQEVEIRPIDEYGKEIKNLKITPHLAKISINIGSLLTKQVPIKPNLVGQPPEGYVLKEIYIEPETVSIKGSQEKIMPIKEIKTSPLNISGATGDMILEITLISPHPDIILTPSVVRLTIRIEKKEIKSLPVEARKGGKEW